jgi:hypothetical protein
MINDLFITRAETEKDYRMRCYIYKMAHPEVTWKEIADTMNDQLSLRLDESTYRKQSKSWLATCSDIPEATNGESMDDETEVDNYIYDLNTLLREIKKAKVQLADERTQNQAYIRKMSREETLLEMAKEVAATMNVKKLLPARKPLITYPYSIDREGILCISDWHYGIEVDNYFNTYNPQICLDRLTRLRDEVIAKGKELKFTKLHVTNLSDLISGRIHMQLRIESRYDAVTQIMHVSEILAEFLSDLSEHFEIEYRDCLDNHSRLEPNKKDSLELESLARIVPWYLEQRLANNKRVKLLYNTYADDIITFNVFDWNVVAVHGHKDTPGKIISNMIAATRKRNDLVLSAHYHHFSADEEHECMRVSNGTLMGVDTHSQDLRLTSKPSQNLIVANRDNVTEFICKINV